jgi:hypothetical protein
MKSSHTTHVPSSNAARRGAHRAPPAGTATAVPALLLRATVSSPRAEHFEADLSLELDGRPSHVARTQFEVAVTPQDHEDLRWYREIYPHYPRNPKPDIASRIEARAQRLGMLLFRGLFESGAGARRLWQIAAENLSRTRIEIMPADSASGTLPWDLISEGVRGQPLCRRAQSLVCIDSKPALAPVATLSRRPAPRIPSR